MGHRHSGGSKQRSTGERTLGYVHEVMGIRGPWHTRSENEVVTRLFTLDAQAMRRKPRERVKPVNGARELSEQVREAVAPLDVRQLVQQNDATSFSVPRRNGRRHHDQ